MKKKFIHDNLFKRRLYKFLLFMALKVFILLITFTLSFASGYSQNKLSVNFKKTSIEQILEYFEETTDFRFVYNRQILKNKVIANLQMHEVSLAEVLDEVLCKNGLDYSIIEGVVVVRDAGKDQQPNAITGKTIPQEELRLIRGKVQTDNGELLPGVTVRIKGTTQGVSTNAKGEYSIHVPNAVGQVLLFSFIGMESQEVVIGEKTEINITLHSSETAIEEVVVTGYANIKKSGFTGSATRITKADFMKVSTGNVLSTLMVFDPSVRLATNTEMGSDPNTLPEFYIRGQSGIGVMDERLDASDVSQYALANNPNLPIFILDGYEVNIQKIYDMDPNRLESITILKDAAATAMYGSRAANGIIVIETTAPQPGNLRVSYNLTGSVTLPDLSDYNMMNAQEKLEVELAAGLIERSSSYHNGLQEYRKRVAAIARGADTYWLSQPLKTRYNHTHSLYVDGGAESVRFGVGINYISEGGVMKKSYRNRFGADLRIDYRVKGFQITDNVSFNRTTSQDSPYGTFHTYVNMLPYITPYNMDTGVLEKQPSFDLTSFYNPLYEASLRNYSRSKTNSAMNNLSINTFFREHFQLRFQLSFTYTDTQVEKFTDPNSTKYDIGAVPIIEKGELSFNRNESFGWNTNLLLMYNNVVNKHYFNFSLGLNAKEDSQKRSSTSYRGFPSAQLNDPKFAHAIVGMPTISDNSSRLIGAFLMGNYTYDNIYLFDLSIRTDGSSMFGKENRFAPFWSFGVGINLHNYGFLENHPVVTLAKLRTNYGQMGRVNFPPYSSRNMYQILLDGWHPTGMGGVLMGIGNKKLTWDKSNTLNVGFDLNLWKRVDVGFSWYNKTTNDMVTSVTLPASSGFTSYTENMGEVSNKGYEMDVRFTVLRKTDWDLNMALRGAHNKNKIVKISDALKEYNDRVDHFYESYTGDNLYSNVRFIKPIRKYEEGGSETAIFGMKSLGISPATGAELFINRDGTVTYDWDPAEQVVIGNTEPDVLGSMSLNLRYKDITLYTTFMYEWGGDAYNSTLVQQVESIDIFGNNVDRRVSTMRWQKPGDIAPLKSISDRYMVTRPTSRFIQKSNYLAFNSLSLGYTMDRRLVQKIGVSMLRVQFTMNDIARISTIKQERGTTYPYAHTYSLTLNAGF